jgi:phage-related protein
MRTSVEEIEGRDGDIVTPLGYSSYDKQISIGLYGNYNVDDVIQFFDSKGTVIFSNEPDKYYNYEIIQQIDFEKLIRFKTATVTFHVQPFKYSAVDEKFTYDKNVLNVRDFEETRNGVTVSCINGHFTISGTATEDTEFYVSIHALELDAGSYSLKETTEGTGESACSIRLIGDVPSNADSFAHTYLTLSEEGTASLSATLTESKTFNFVWINVTSETELDFSMDVEVLDNNISNFSILNHGNTQSKPTITIYGSGLINLSLNGTQVFVIELGNSEHITISSALMEAYQGETLMNRLVIGDYSKFILNIGTNIISWTGDVTKIEVEDYTRWI